MMSDNTNNDAMQRMADAYAEHFIKPLIKLQAEAVNLLTPSSIEEFTEAELDGVWKTYVEGQWLTFDQFVAKFKDYRNKVA